MEYSAISSCRFPLLQARHPHEGPALGGAPPLLGAPGAVRGRTHSRPEPVRALVLLPDREQAAEMRELRALDVLRLDSAHLPNLRPEGRLGRGQEGVLKPFDLGPHVAINSARVLACRSSARKHRCRDDRGILRSLRSGTAPCSGTCFLPPAPGPRRPVHGPSCGAALRLLQVLQDVLDVFHEMQRCGLR